MCLVGYLPRVGLKRSVTAGVVGVMQSMVLPALACTSFHIRNILSSTSQKQYLTSGPCSTFNTSEGTIIIVHAGVSMYCKHRWLYKGKICGASVSFNDTGRYVGILKVSTTLNG